MTNIMENNWIRNINKLNHKFKITMQRKISTVIYYQD